MKLPWQIRSLGLYTPRFMLYGIGQALRHPMTPVRYRSCHDCRINLPFGKAECPVCGQKVGRNPGVKSQSPVPWWGSVVIISIGVICWCVGEGFDIEGLAEAARALVYLPLGALFDRSLPR